MKKCEMFCYQCQETARGTGCTKVGVCGKRPELSSMLDLLIYVTKGLSCVTTKLREEGKEIGKDVNHLVTVNLFTTITNANFDRDAIVARIKETLKVKEDLRSKLTDLDSLPEAALWNGSESEFDAKADSDAVGVLSTENEDIRSLREMITYGLKGLAAYSKHANALMQDNEKIDAFLQRALAKTLDDSLTVDDLVALTLETGKFGVDGMALLDSANTGAYGNPEITEVNIGVRNNPGILISGHDLKDLEQLLEQTKGTGVDVYTHSEMLPAHYYPAFKKSITCRTMETHGEAEGGVRDLQRTDSHDHELHCSSCRFLQGQTVDNRCRTVIRDAATSKASTEPSRTSLPSSNRLRLVHRRRKSKPEASSAVLRTSRSLLWRIRSWRPSSPARSASLSYGGLRRQNEVQRILQGIC